MGVDIVVVGASLGGLHALKIVLGGLPATLAGTVAIVQHRGDGGDELARMPDGYSVLPVREPDDKEVSIAGTAYLAPPGYHLLVDRGTFALSTDAPVSFARPSIDVLFESAAQIYADRVVGVILTGTGHDGARGLATIKAHGGYAIVEEPSTAERGEMPRAALGATRVDRVVPLSEIAGIVAGLRHDSVEC